MRANGLPRMLSAGYPLVGGTRQRHFDGANLKPRKLLENAQSPTSRVHAVLGRFPVNHVNIHELPFFKTAHSVSSLSGDIFSVDIDTKHRLLLRW